MPDNRDPLVALTLTEAAALLEQLCADLTEPSPIVEHLAKLIERGLEHSRNRTAP